MSFGMSVMPEGDSVLHQGCVETPVSPHLAVDFDLNKTLSKECLKCF